VLRPKEVEQALLELEKEHRQKERKQTVLDLEKQHLQKLPAQVAIPEPKEVVSTQEIRVETVPPQIWLAALTWVEQDAQIQVLVAEETEPTQKV